MPVLGGPPRPGSSAAQVDGEPAQAYDTGEQNEPSGLVRLAGFLLVECRMRVLPADLNFCSLRESTALMRLKTCNQP